MAEEVAYDRKQMVIFKIGSEEFGIDINDVRNIEKFENLTTVPGADEYIEGVLNLRGKIIVILNLAKKINISSKGRSKDSRIVIVELHDETLGLLVDTANEVLWVNDKNIKDAPKIIKDKIGGNYIKGVAIQDERMIILIDLKKILTPDEVKKIAKVGV